MEKRKKIQKKTNNECLRGLVYCPRLRAVGRSPMLRVVTPLSVRRMSPVSTLHGPISSTYPPLRRHYATLRCHCTGCVSLPDKLVFHGGGGAQRPGGPVGDDGDSGGLEGGSCDDGGHFRDDRLHQRRVESPADL